MTGKDIESCEANKAPFSFESSEVSKVPTIETSVTGKEVKSGEASESSFIGKEIGSCEASNLLLSEASNETRAR